MKKKLLFVIPSLGEGGAEKSLLTLLKVIDYKKYEVDLLAFNPAGMKAEPLPRNVNILELPKNYVMSKKPLLKSVISFLLRGKFNLAFYRFKYSQTLLKFGYSNKAEQYAWKYLSKFFPVIETNYDAAIGYLEKSANYFVADNVQAKTKINYIHSNYENLKTDAAFDFTYFEMIDWVVTVSKTCAENLLGIIPAVKNKIKIVENIILKDEIIRLSESEPLFGNSYNGKIMLTVGRISEEKGIDLAVEACKTLLVDGWRVRWYHIGTGEQQANIEKLIETSGLRDSFILLGQKKNPYPYMAQCDIYIQPSRYEGKSIAIEEAKALAKPIVATRYAGIGDQINDGVTGLVAEINSKSIAGEIARLLQDPGLCKKFSENLKSYSGNTSGIKNFYELI